MTGEITTCLGDKMPLGAETHKEQPWQPGALAGRLQALGKRTLGHWASKKRGCGVREAHIVSHFTNVFSLIM